MTPNTPNPARGDATGFENVVCFGGEHLPDKAAAQKNQAKILRLVRPPRPRRIDVTIAASDGRSPIGRTRAIRLTEPDLAWLLEAAQKLEARR